ncbi:hypothetical protein [Streptomyces rapamycinicus]|uniref:Uncharacterized protein n=2 Tax=Streptomyces rapamycinicus TaxID=1226757 RepID=A0A3L8RFI3_STRRN|nr:hypothetical protein [Streptomyces rapamycinicus]MBB4786023.1 hypothetical protein [Streptomyces rapamycinicus]RLV78514.1 hypothetical protein D3C57_109055 [Streptomyces rapamycinicus NRRL 5491]UTO66145.1 hypothetical protein LJB45_30045 [Streptomyces rapamycinicus]UTP34099.1 hypothetical protein LIV37_35180 [Streptomyces rapamycinicus NRRL 5491]
MSSAARLLKAQSVIVCSLAPYKGRPVQYRPRHRHDAQPWVLGAFRYSGRECHAVNGK